MTAHIVNGRVEFDDPCLLAEGTLLEVTVINSQPSPSPRRRTLLERMANSVGTVHDLPEDMALNHDHYLYGAPKK